MINKKIISVFASMVLCTSVIAGNVQLKEAKAATEWNLVWQDDFNGNSLDLSKWSYQEGTGQDVGLTDWGNNELQTYSKNNVAVTGGELVIEARREAKDGKNYTSGRINTKGKFSKTYGRIEAAITLPKGQGLWPAFWMLPTDNKYGNWASSGEIDIMEARGREPNKVDGTIHYGGTWPNNQYKTANYTFPQGQSIAEKHVYAVEWEKNEIRWYVDGNLYHKTSDWSSNGAPYPAPFDQNFYILFNLAVGGNYDGNIQPNDSVVMPAKMKVDYVKVYNKSEVTTPSGNSIVNGDFSNGLANWGTWSPDSNNRYVVGENGAVTYHIINKGNETWSQQLYQDVPQLIGGKKYKLSFNAFATMNRPIIVEFAGSNLQQKLVTFQLNTANNKYEATVDVPINTNLKLNFLLGNVNGAATPSVQHAVVIDNVTLNQI
jgi:beta-glucanase (GH16 family)